MEEGLPFPRRLPVIPGKVVAIIVVAALAVIGAAVYRYRLTTTQSAAAYTTAAAQRGTITDTVTGTGPIAAANAVPLNFKNSGKVAAIDVNVGDKVKAGQVLAKMDTSDLTSQLNQAQANLANAQAAYNKLAEGPQPADIQVAQAGVNTAKNQLANAQKNLAAVQAQIDASTASDKVTVQNAQQALTDAQKTQAALPAVIAQQIAQAKNNLYSAQLTRDATCGRGSGGQCDAANATVNAQQSALDQANASAVQQTAQQQAAVDQAQSTLNAANATLQNDQAKNKASLVTAQTSVQSAQDGVNSALANLAKAEEPATQADLDAAKAQIAAQQASVQLAKNNLDAAVLTAPFDGTVTAINGAVGQWLVGGATSGAAVSTASGASASSSSSSSSSSFLAITQLSGLQVTSQVNEADISKVQLGQPVTFTVDAFPNRTFTGKVAVIQPLGQNVQNVVSYSVTATIDPTNATLLPGMTASTNIIVGQAKDVVEVPMSALTYARGQLANRFAGGQRPQGQGGFSPAGASGQAGAGRGPGAAAQAQRGVRAQGGGPQAQTPGQAAAAQGQAAGQSAAQGQRAGQGAGAGQAINRQQFEQPGGPGALYVLKDGKPTLVRVLFGISDGRLVEVKSGLQAGDQVVTGGGTSVAQAQPAASNNRPRGGGGAFFVGR